MSAPHFIDVDAIDELAAWWHAATHGDPEGEVSGADLTDVVRRLLDRVRPAHQAPSPAFSCPECGHHLAEHYGKRPKESYPSPRLCRHPKADGHVCRCTFTKPAMVADAPVGRGYKALPRLRLVRMVGRTHSRAEPLRSAQEVFDLFREDAPLLDREYFWAVLLDGRNRVIGVDEVAVGTMTAALVHPRELFKAAILANSAALIVVHNHPSGDPEPSSEDIALTRRLIEAGDIIGIKVIDHVVLGDGRYRSLSEEGEI